jgi:hypothetical protein
MPEVRADPLFRLDGAVTRDAAVEEWLAEPPSPLGVLVRRWFDVIRGCGDDVVELVHDGCPVACVGDAAFAYVDAFTAHVNVGFFRGAELPDPRGLLQGSGKMMRHVKLVPGERQDDAALRALIAASYANIRAHRR